MADSWTEHKVAELEARVAALEAKLQSGTPSGDTGAPVKVAQRSTQRPKK